MNNKTEERRETFPSPMRGLFASLRGSVCHYLYALAASMFLVSLIGSPQKGHSLNSSDTGFPQVEHNIGSLPFSSILLTSFFRLPISALMFSTVIDNGCMPLTSVRTL